MLTFLTPLGGLIALAVLLPLAAYFVSARRVARVRSRLRLERPARRREWVFVAALGAVPLLLALVAMQPAWRTSEARRVRTDAQAFVVIDTSRSMLASARPDSPTRLDRAKAAAIAIRDALPGVSTGVGTMTDRVLPNLLPSPDAKAFAATVRQAVGIEQPPPASTGVTATSVGSIAGIQAGGTFAPSARKRAIVVLTDGESRPFDTAALADALGATKLVLVHVWGPREAVFRADGTPEGAYRPDPASGAELDSLAGATGGSAFGERQTAAAAKAVRDALGNGPTVRLGLEPHTRALGRFLALLALLPLGLVLWRRNLR
ncbi:MAG: VWA domain-containing protein [Gaiellaceae bacterium]